MPRSRMEVDPGSPLLVLMVKPLQYYRTSVTRALFKYKFKNNQIIAHKTHANINFITITTKTKLP